LLQLLCQEEPTANTLFKHYPSLEDIYVALGREELQVEQILQLHQLALLLHQTEKASEKHRQDEYADYVSIDNHSLRKAGEAMHQVQLGQCCYPLPSDQIVGSLTPDQGMIVHRTDCQMLRRQQGNAHSSISLNWLQVEPDAYQTPITIVAHDRSGL